MVLRDSPYFKQVELIMKEMPESTRIKIEVFTDLPGVQWKQQNLQRMDKNKRKQAIEKLENVLYG